MVAIVVSLAIGRDGGPCRVAGGELANEAKPGRQGWPDDARAELATADAVQRLTGAYHLQERALLEVLREDATSLPQRMTKEKVIDVLSAMRSRAAVPMLIEQIEFESFFSRAERLSGFPAARALCEIGIPARREILAQLRKDIPSRKIELFALVLVVIEDGREFAKQRAEYLLDRRRRELAYDAKRAGEPAGPDTYAANLERLIEFYEDDIKKSPRLEFWEREERADKEPRTPRN